MEDKATSGPGKEHGNPEDTGELGDYSCLVIQVSGVMSPAAVLRVMSTHLDWSVQQAGRVPGLPVHTLSDS